MNYLLPKIPSPYKLVEYIESSGTQWIDLGFAPNQTTKATCNFTYYTDSNTYNVIFGCREQYQNKQFMAWVKSDDTSHGIRIDYANGVNIYGQEMSQTPEGAVANNTYLTYELGHAYFKCPELGINHTFPDDPSYQGDFTCARNLYLFARNQSGPDWYCSAKVYRFTAEHNGSIIREMYPVKNNTTNEYGMYDVINKQFYGNNGTGSFTGGNVVQQVEYLRSGSGVINTVINTGVKLDYYSRVESKFSEIRSQSDTFLYGAREAYTVKAFAFFQGWAAFGSDAGGGGAGTVFPIGVPTEFKQDNTGFYINGVLARTYNETEFETPVNCSIFNCTQGREGSYYKTSNNYADCYYFKIYKNNVLVRSFIPIVINNEYGMIDLVEFKVYLNVGTGTFTGGNVVPMYVTKEFLFDKKVEILPSGYTQLEYLQNGAGGYVNTGIIPSFTDTFEIKCKKAQNYSIFGSGSSRYNFTGGAGLQMMRIGDSGNNFEADLADSLHTVTYDGTSIFIDGNIAVQTVTKGSNSPTLTMYMYCRNYNNTPNDGTGNQQIAYFKLSDENGVQKLYYIAAKRNSDNTLGFYDLVTNTFIVGTGTFTAGPEITSNTYISVKTVSRLPQGYKELDYIQSYNGSNGMGSYIDTGVKATGTISWDVEYERTNATGWAGVIGCRKASGAYRYWIIYQNNTTEIGLNSDNNAAHPAVLNTKERRKLVVTETDNNKWHWEVQWWDYTNNQWVNDYNSSSSAQTVQKENTLGNILLFAINYTHEQYAAMYAISLKMYSCKIWDGDTLIRNYIPCKNSNNEVGMYDAVNGTFNTSATQYAFTAGNEVHDTELYLSIKEA